MKTLLVYPTHENLREVQESYEAAGIDARAYPPRLTKDSKSVAQNCWNEVADEAEAMGFAVVRTVCPQCKERKDCKVYGYLADLANVKSAPVVLCTQKRVEYTDFVELMKGRQFVSVHENPVDMLRPGAEATEADLIQVQLVLNRLMTDPVYLDWFGDALSVDDDGETYLDEELGRRKQRLYDFTQHLCRLVDELVELMQRVQATTEWSAEESMRRPVGIERLLFKVTKTLKIHYADQPWRFVLGAATGELASSAITVSKQHRPSGRGEPLINKTAIGFRNNPPSREATTWFNDATLRTDTLANILGSEVWDKTPGGRLELQKKAVQVLRDITRRTSSPVFAKILRGILVDRSQFQRIGVICHRPHIEALKSLEPDFAQRIVKTTYFGSGEERSSNAWHQECDLIVIAGTPRLPPQTIASYLIQVGKVGAACREAAWGTIKWEGRTESGDTVTVTARGYHDESWRRAHQDLVRAAIVQAVGRGRGILPTGCEVIVLSTEECGLAISDAELRTLNGSSSKILSALRELTMESPNKYILGKSIVSTAVVAQAAGLSEVRARELLRDLEQRGLVQKIGERSGWRLTSQLGDDDPGTAQSAFATSTNSHLPGLRARDGPAL